MTQPHRLAIIGTGFISNFYTTTLHGGRGLDRVHLCYSRTEDRGKAFADQWGIPKYTTNLEDAVGDEDIDTVVIGLPNHRHQEAVEAAQEDQNAAHELNNAWASARDASQVV